MRPWFGGIEIINRTGRSWANDSAFGRVLDEKVILISLVFDISLKPLS